MPKQALQHGAQCSLTKVPASSRSLQLEASSPWLYRNKSMCKARQCSYSHIVAHMGVAGMQAQIITDACRQSISRGLRSHWPEGSISITSQRITGQVTAVTWPMANGHHTAASLFATLALLTSNCYFKQAGR